MEQSHPILKDGLKGLTFNAAREVEVAGGRKAVLLYVPFPQLGEYRKVQKVLIDELEKKLTGLHVLIIANRTMVSSSAWARNTKVNGVRPRSRSLKAVQESLLDDIVYPTEVVGKRTRVRADQPRLLKVQLSTKDQSFVEGKLETFSAVYKKLTQRDVAFSF